MQDFTVRKSIFIVDDNPINLSVLYNYLVKLDYDVSVFQSGRDAIEEAKKDPPGLILLDVRMPDIDGFETCRTLKEHEITTEIPVIFMSALSDTINKIKAFEAGGVDYITKPFHQEEVLSRVKAHLAIRQEKEELSVESESKDYLFSVFMDSLEKKLNDIINMKRDDSSFSEMYEKIEKLDEFVNEVDKRYGGNTALKQSFPANINTDASLKEIKRILTPDTEKKQVSLDINCDPELLIYSDPSLFKKALLNLLKNSVLLCPQKGEITVKVNKIENMRVLITILINDFLLEKADEDTIFSLDGLISIGKLIKVDGYGYGLITARAMIRTINGKVTTGSNPAGTSISISLPGVEA
jgi:two-component system, sensor histidine kinase and response regulator